MDCYLDLSAPNDFPTLSSPSTQSNTAWLKKEACAFSLGKTPPSFQTWFIFVFYTFLHTRLLSS